VEAAAKTYYPAFDSASAVAAAIEVASLANKIFQDAEPWKRAKTEPEAARDIATLCLNLARSAAVILAPVVPSLIESVYKIFGLPGAPKSFDEANAFDLVDRPIGTPARILDPVDKKQLEAIVEASKPKDGAPAEAPQPTNGEEKKKAPKAEPPKAETQKTEAAPSKGAPAEKGPPAEISVEELAKVDLRVGLVLSADLVEGADKLLKLSIDLGEAKGPRTIFAGLRSAYEPAALIGKRVVVVANLKPRKMRFGVSEGMVLAAGPGGKDIWVLGVPDGAPPGSEIK
jgi:methionyl-tRNA synthetase